MLGVKKNPYNHQNLQLIPPPLRGCDPQRDQQGPSEEETSIGRQGNVGVELRVLYTFVTRYKGWAAG